jgi:hypothetical protein
MMRCRARHMRTFLLLLAALTACNSSGPGRTSIDATLAALIPPDATILAGVHMDAVRATPLFQNLVAGRSLTQPDDFARQTGFDPRRDVREMLIAADGKDLLVAARGTFKESAAAALAKQPYHGVMLYTRDDRGVAFLDPSTAVAGTLPAVKAALDRYKSGGGSGPAELLARARQIPAQNQIWSVSNGFDNPLTAAIPETGNAANAGRILRSLENMTFAADLRAGVNGYLTGTCSTEPDAKNLGDTVRGLIGLGRLSVPEKQPELLRLWDGIKVDQQQRTVTITVMVPQVLLEKLLDWLKLRPGLRRLPVNGRVSPRSAPSSDQESRRPE